MNRQRIVPGLVAGLCLYSGLSQSQNLSTVLLEDSLMWPESVRLTMTTEELERFFVSDPVDAAWSGQMESSLWRAISELDYDFRGVDIGCKTSICKITSRIRFGSQFGDGAFRIYSNAYREVTQSAFRPAMADGGRRLDQVHGDAGPVSVHYLYSWQINPALVAVANEVRGHQ